MTGLEVNQPWMQVFGGHPFIFANRASARQMRDCSYQSAV